MSKQATKIEMRMTVEKETPGTVRYAEVTEGERPHTLYLQKALLPKPYPQEITVTIVAEG